MKLLFLPFILFALYSSSIPIDDDWEQEAKLFQGYLFNHMQKSIPNIVTEWKEFKKMYNVTIPWWETRRRFFIFAKNLLFIHSYNQEDHQNSTVEPNHYIFQSREEYFQTLGTVPQNLDDSDEGFTKSLNPENLIISSSNLPDRDWRKSKSVTAVKNQGQCGGCYSFAALAATESAIAIKTKKLIPLSEQSIIDCSSNYGNMGCNGGNLDFTFRYMMNNPVPMASKYPYTGRDGKCRLQGTDDSTLVKDYRRIRSGDEEELSSVISNVGPVAVAIDARYDSFKFYKSGILYEPKCSTNTLNHGVTVVGIGSSPKPYYIVKNSYGTRWGNSGYIHMARYMGNNCGITSGAVYPLV